MNHRRDVCLIAAKAPKIGEEYIFPHRNLGLALIASSLRREGFSVDIINTQAKDMNIEQLLEEVKYKCYGFIGISVLSVKSWKYAKELIARLRAEGFKQHITVGGIFATFNYKQIFKDFNNGQVDCVALGEGEETIVDLYNKISNGLDWRDIKNVAYCENKKIIVNPTQCIKDLDRIPFASADEVSEIIEKGQLVNIQTSRGCYGSCTYCNIRSFYGEGGSGWRYRTPQSVVDELEMWTVKYEAKRFIFVDDNFIGPGKLGRTRAMEICNEIIKRNLNIEFFMECRPNDLTEELCEALSKAGCRYAFVGFESGSDNQLREIGKGEVTREINKKVAKMLTRYNIKYFPGFIMFTPNCTLKDIKDNIDMLRYLYSYTVENNLPVFLSSYVPFTVLEAIKGTKIFENLMSERRLSLDKRGKRLSYLVADPEAELVRRLFTESGMHEYINDLEKDIQEAEYALDNIKQRHIIDEYEQVRTFAVLEYLEKIIKLVEEKDLSKFNILSIEVKKKIALEVIKHTKRMATAKAICTSN